MCPRKSNHSDIDIWYCSIIDNIFFDKRIPLYGSIFMINHPSAFTSDIEISSSKWRSNEHSCLFSDMIYGLFWNNSELAIFAHKITCNIEKGIRNTRFRNFKRSFWFWAYLDMILSRSKSSSINTHTRRTEYSTHHYNIASDWNSRIGEPEIIYFYTLIFTMNKRIGIFPCQARIPASIHWSE